MIVICLINIVRPA